MKTLTATELKEKHLLELADLERKESLAAILPSLPTYIHLHKDHVSVVYGKDYPSRYTLREALAILDQYTPITAEHWKSGCLSVRPAQINDYAKENGATKEGEHTVEIKLSAGKGYDSHSFSFWSILQGELLQVTIDLQPEWKWLPETDFQYDIHGHCTSSRVSPACIGEDFRRKWWSPEGSYQISYYWKTMESFNQEFRPL